MRPFMFIWSNEVVLFVVWHEVAFFVVWSDEVVFCEESPFNPSKLNENIAAKITIKALKKIFVPGWIRNLITLTQHPSQVPLISSILTVSK